MKQLLVSAFLILLLANVNAQVKIGGTPVAPVPSAVLELDGGTNKGLLLPRMTLQNITDIQNAAEGLMIYATDQKAVYLRKNLVWEKQGGFALPFAGVSNGDYTAFSVSNSGTLNSTAIAGQTTIGTALFGEATGAGGYAVAGTANNASGIGGVFANTQGARGLIVANGRTGIGTFSPDALFHINGNAQTGASVIIDDDQDLSIQLQKAGISKGFIQLNTDDIRLGTNLENTAGKVVFRTGGIDRVQLFNDGEMTIGSILNKDATLSTFAANDALNKKANIDLQSNYGTTFGPTIKFTGRSPVFGELASITSTSTRVVNSSKTGRFDFVQPGLENPLAFLRFKAGSNHNGVLNVTKSVLVGPVPLEFGEAAFQVKGPGIGLDYDYTMILQESVGSPIVSLRSASGADKGLIQVAGDDMKIGTFANNDLGRFAVRTNGFDRLFVNPDGRVIIGSTTGSSAGGTEMLKVKGGVMASAFTVQTVASWPDYVFADDYKLKSLEETEAFIKTNKHLPNIPAAAAIEKNGLELGDMQKRMMEKVEELTLYLIEANKAIKELSASRVEDKKEISLLKNQVSLLQSNK